MYFIKIKNIKKYIKFLLLIFTFFYNNLFENCKIFFITINFKYQVKKIENYLKFLNND